MAKTFPCMYQVDIAWRYWLKKYSIPNVSTLQSTHLQYTHACSDKAKCSPQTYDWLDLKNRLHVWDGVRIMAFTNVLERLCCGDWWVVAAKLSRFVYQNPNLCYSFESRASQISMWRHIFQSMPRMERSWWLVLLSDESINNLSFDLFCSICFKILWVNRQSVL